MLTVADIMTKSVVTLSPFESLAQAADTLAMMGVSGAPVCDAGARAIGVFSKSDVLGGLVDGRLRPDAVVKDHMTKVTISLRAGDPVTAAVSVMAERSIHRLLVLDDAEHVVGIVSPLDILKAIHDGRLRLEGGAGA
ncbi:MAG: CBS domain-containing protein [Labilithrix sp.]|nr:CBS domain-containing protein [Labilithrix sp.]